MQHTGAGFDDADDVAINRCAAQCNRQRFAHNIRASVRCLCKVLVHKANRRVRRHVAFGDQPPVQRLEGKHLFGARVNAPDHTVCLGVLGLQTAYVHHNGYGVLNAFDRLDLGEVVCAQHRAFGVFFGLDHDTAYAQAVQLVVDDLFADVSYG